MSRSHLQSVSRKPAPAGGVGQGCFKFWSLFVDQATAAEKCDHGAVPE